MTKLSERLDKAAHDMDATQETRNTAWQALDLLDECERVLTYYAATVSESRRCYAVNLLAKLRSQEKAD